MGDTRQLLAVVIYDSGYSRLSCSESIGKASEHLGANHGILLRPVEWIEHKWKGTSRSKLLWEESKQVEGRTDFDIVIGFYSEPIHAYVLGELMGSDWKAVVDDVYRRYIITKSLDWFDLAHEVTHGFVFSKVHDGWGILGANQLGFPFVPYYIRSDRVSTAIKDEVASNKWRDFSDKVVVPDPEDIPAAQ